MKNAFTVDVEDYFQVEGFAQAIDRNSWEGFRTRVGASTSTLLELLARRGVHATFFVLGWVARKHPEIVRQIAAAGHEVASHGMSHRLVYTQTPEEFRRETRDAKALLEDLAQRPVEGYRAATYSITRRSLWALDILCEEGFRYDSSIFPMRHDRYGIPDAEPTPHVLTAPGGGRLVEFPISVLRYRGAKVPVAGGGYFRLFPYRFTRWALRRLNEQQQEFVFYIHPWEVDPEQPRVGEAGALSRFRHYLNLGRCAERLGRLLEDFEFDTMRSVLARKNLLPVQ
ncbi:MAG TPA: XrtA system polysaccharide deacetylase [Burkholderiales bacterium]|nr:XrtA system polysaccharide deacetylase [Burkholderiales bacterium]